MVPINFSQKPERKMVDKFLGVPTGSMYHLYLQAGKEEYGYSFQIEIAKKLARLLSQHVEAFEKATGQKLDDRLDNDPLPTPLEGFGGPPNQETKS